MAKIDKMVALNKRSLEVDWNHLVDYSATLAIATFEKPERMLDILNAALVLVIK